MLFRACFSRVSFIFCTTKHPPALLPQTELGIFFPLIALRPLEMIIDPSKYAGAVSAVAESVQRQRVDLSLKMLLELCKEPQVLVDLYVNYDCDMEAANLFERTLLTLVDLLQVRAGPEAKRPHGCPGLFFCENTS